MFPKLILHNSISLDGSLTDFDVNMALHYHIVGKYNPDAHLIGSNTIKTGIKLYGEAPPEKEKDFKKPLRDKKLPYWIIIDSKGSLQGLLHEIRRFEFCKDVVILLSEKTSDDYINYLRKREYQYHIIGKENVDLRKAQKFLMDRYKIKKILTDTGKILGNLLLNENVVDEISLLIHPVIVGKKSYLIFNQLDKKINLKLLKKEILEKNYIWLTFKINHRY